MENMSNRYQQSTSLSNTGKIILQDIFHKVHCHSLTWYPNKRDLCTGQCVSLAFERFTFH